MMVNGLHVHDTNTNTNAASSSVPTNAINSNDFMTLLVAEIQNQDPTQPMDPTTFMSQLVQLNQLEQLTDINQVAQQYAKNSNTSGTTPTGN